MIPKMNLSIFNMIFQQLFACHVCARERSLSFGVYSFSFRNFVCVYLFALFFVHMHASCYHIGYILRFSHRCIVSYIYILCILLVLPEAIRYIVRCVCRSVHVYIGVAAGWNSWWWWWQRNERNKTRNWLLFSGILYPDKITKYISLSLPHTTAHYTFLVRNV